MKRTEQQSYRITEKDKKALAKIAEEMCMPAALLVSILASEFVKAKKMHGKRLIFPPEFNHFTEEARSVQEKEQG